VCCVTATNSEQNLLNEHDHEEVLYIEYVLAAKNSGSHLAEMCSQYVLTLQQQNGAHTHIH